MFSDCLSELLHFFVFVCSVSVCQANLFGSSRKVRRKETKKDIYLLSCVSVCVNWTYIEEEEEEVIYWKSKYGANEHSVP